MQSAIFEVLQRCGTLYYKDFFKRIAAHDNDVWKRWKYFFNIKADTLELSFVIVGIQNFLEPVFDAITTDTTWIKSWRCKMADRINQTSRMRNSSYIFVPFSFSPKISTNIEEYWKIKEQDNKYFLKYIVDKFSHNANTFFCKPYIMDDMNRQKLSIIDSTCKIYTDTTKYSKSGTQFKFCINGIQLFIFDTGIGFVAYKIEHEDTEDALSIASKNYHLKKIFNTKIYGIKEDGTKLPLVTGISSVNSFSALSEYILGKTFTNNIDIFFNYSSKQEQRSNILTHFNLNLDHQLEDADSKTIDNALFYLKRNYHYQWNRSTNELVSKKEYYRASPYIHWGITSEATVCITITDPQTYFVGNSFYDNFHTYYLYTYVIALHQKYSLYHFLTKFSTNVDVVELENCLSELAEFRAKYVYQIISESETYQSVYNKVRQAFSLDELFTDIDEQVKRVIDIKERRNSHNTIIRENKLNIILGILAFFGLFSIINDVNDLILILENVWNSNIVFAIQVVSDIIVILIGVFLLIRFFIISKKTIKKDKKGKKGEK